MLFGYVGYDFMVRALGLGTKPHLPPCLLSHANDYYSPAGTPALENSGELTPVSILRANILGTS